MELTISRLGWKKKPLPAFIPLFPDSLVLPAPFTPCSLLLNEIILFLGSYCSQNPSHRGESGSRLRSPQTPRAQYLLMWRHFVHKRLYLTLSHRLPVQRVLAKFIMPDQKYPPIRVETLVMPEKNNKPVIHIDLSWDSSLIASERHKAIQVQRWIVERVVCDRLINPTWLPYNIYNKLACRLGRVNYDWTASVFINQRWKTQTKRHILLQRDDESRPTPQPKLFTWLGEACGVSKTLIHGEKGRIIGLFFFIVRKYKS